MRSPAAEVDIDAELVDRLVRSQHPELAGPVRIVASGWDNVIARLGAEHVVRLPRRAASAALVGNEARWLPTVAAMLPVPVSVPIRLGMPQGRYPFEWVICTWLEGVPVTEVPVADRRAIAAELGAAHAALHRPAPRDAPRNPVRGVPLAARDAAVVERLSGGIPHSVELARMWRRACDAPPWAGPALWLHGDPHPANLLASRREHEARLAAIIDFGDVCSGDPATDLAVGWLAFDAEGRDAYRRARGEIDAATWARAHGWAVALAIVFLESSDDRPDMAAIGGHALEQVLSDPPR